MNILIIGGMHGNELLGVELVKLLQASPIKGVDAMIANPEAVISGQRYIETDLNRSFGLQPLQTYETRRVEEMRVMTQSYDLVFDFHNTQTPDNDCAFVGAGCNPLLYDVMRLTNLNHCIEATYDCINKYCLNAISIEISMDSPLNNAMVWYEKIAALSASMVVPDNKITVYQFRRRVTWKEQEQYKLGGWRPFVPLVSTDKQRLNTSGDIVPIFIGSKLTEYYATLLEKTGEI